MFLLVHNFIGLGLGPLVFGIASDRLAPSYGTASIRVALTFGAAFYLVAALLCGLAALRLTRDSESASI
jgi:hypothetical protein